MRFKIDWASLIVGRKFIVFALFYFVFKGNFQVQAPRGHIWRGDLMVGFLRYEFGGFIFGGAYSQNFTVCQYLQGFYNYKKINNIFLKFLRDLLRMPKIIEIG